MCFICNPMQIYKVFLLLVFSVPVRFIHGTLLRGKSTLAIHEDARNLTFNELHFTSIEHSNFHDCSAAAPKANFQQIPPQGNFQRLHKLLEAANAGVIKEQGPAASIEHPLPTRPTAAEAAAAKAAAPAATAAPPAAGRPARIYFLFMAVDKVSNLKVWSDFFAKAPIGQYRAFIHCKLPECHGAIGGSVLQAVPTVPSYYCTDLVSPMNQLLAHALADDPVGNPADKFAFVSDSTLPGKPFSQMYHTLVTRAGSDFCAFPSGEWADVPGANGLEMAVKYHQWITLNRAHAQKASNLWATGTWHNFMTHFQMNTQSYVYSNNTYGDNRNFGCLDEFWHMVAVYGTLSHVDRAQDAVASLDLFTGGPLRVAANAGWQGECDTFVVWAKYLDTPGNNPFQRLHSLLDPASIPHGGNSHRPGWWDSISRYGITMIRNSDFLFVRKFIDNPTLADGGDFAAEYSRIVFTDTV